MPTNFYYNNFENSGEQTLLDDLIVESIKIHGQDMWYLPRTLKNKNEILGQSDIVEYNSAYMVPIYIENVDGFGGEGNFLSKFGLEIRDQVTFSIAVKTFRDDVASSETENTLSRPREGDLIYFPLNRKCFQILFVDKFQMYYPLGSLHTWKLTCELFEYSSERFNTGIGEIDILEQKFSADILQWAIFDEDGNFLITESGGDIYVDEEYGLTSPEPISDNQDIQTQSNTFIDFSTTDPFSEGNI